MIDANDRSMLIYAKETISEISRTSTDIDRRLVELIEISTDSKKTHEKHMRTHERHMDRMEGNQYDIGRLIVLNGWLLSVIILIQLVACWHFW